MPRKLSSEDRKTIEAERFREVFGKLTGNPDTVVSPRIMSKLGHDCPDSATTRAKLFKLLEARNIGWEQFHRFLWPHHAQYLYEAYHAGMLDLRQKVAA